MIRKRPYSRGGRGRAAEAAAPPVHNSGTAEHALGSVDEKPRTPGGKKPPTPDEDGEGEDSDSDDESVPKIKWDYEGNDGYYVEVDGSKVRSRISKFTQEKWDKVSDKYTYQTTFTSASKDEISQACYDTLLEYVKSTR